TTLLGGTKVNELHQDQQSYDVVVWADPAVRAQESDLHDLELDLPNGKGTVRLRDVARLKRTKALNTIRHYKTKRCIDVSCNVKPGTDLSAVVREIQDRIAHLQQEKYHFEILGEYKARQENQRQ